MRQHHLLREPGAAGLGKDPASPSSFPFFTFPPFLFFIYSFSSFNPFPGIIYSLRSLLGRFSFPRHLGLVAPPNEHRTTQISLHAYLPQISPDIFAPNISEISSEPAGGRGLVSDPDPFCLTAAFFSLSFPFSSFCFFFLFLSIFPSLFSFTFLFFSFIFLLSFS